MTDRDLHSFIAKARELVGVIPFVRDLVAMYYAMLDDRTPVWAKLQIGAAIAYFVMPFDAIPDFLPPFPVGYSDDAAVVMGCLRLVHVFVTPEHRRRATAFFNGKRR